jgi:diguanylate cyclase (GGDEF)-like protein
MPAATQPADEEARLASLYALELLDTPPDPKFDSLVRLAADVHNVPIALVTLVDRARQWFKASVGLCRQETPREDAFCAHTILNPSEIMVVEDARCDRRFADNPLVTGYPGIRFYAGAPICCESGHVLGSLCIIDTCSRRLDEPDRRRLAALAAGVSALVDLHGRALSLHRAATLDLLTGLSNRHFLDQRLERAAAAASAEGGVPHALLFIDLDRFKDINDSYGHAAGDALLRAVAERLRKTVRRRDFVARFGGDEFAVLAPGVLCREEAATLANRILQALGEPYRLNCRPCLRPGASLAGSGILHLPGIGVSVGIALCPNHARDAASLMRVADSAMYLAKRRGGDRIAFADETVPVGGAPNLSDLLVGLSCLG